MSFCVYRHIDKEGVLLYVGLSLKPLARLAQHGRTSSWFDQISLVTIERFGTMREAAHAEAEAIKNEAPRYNIVGVPEGRKRRSRRRQYIRDFEIGERFVFSHTPEQEYELISDDGLSREVNTNITHEFSPSFNAQATRKNQAKGA